jgi:predicted permease
VRLALGASPGRVAAQLLTEGAALSLPAGALGVALAWQATRLVSAIRIPIARGASISFDLGLDSRTLAVSVAVTVATVLLVGLAPALDSSRLNLVAALKEVRDGVRRGSRSRRALLSAQVAVSMALLAGGGLFLRSFQHACEVDLGFDPAGVVATSVDTGPRAYSPDEGRAFWSRLLGEVRRLPRVESASLTARLPLELGIVMTSLAPEGFAPADASAWPSVEFAIVEIGYFETMRIPLIEGRDFADRDTGGAPAVAVVNDVLARQFWPDTEAIGCHLVTRRRSHQGDRRRQALGLPSQEKTRLTYFPLRQAEHRAMTIVARGAAGDSGALLRAIGGVVRRLDPEAPLYDVTTMSERVAVSLAPASGGAVALGVVALMVLALTAVGLFGAVAHTVSRRTYEIGVRRALGATDGSVVWLMTRDAVLPVAVGIAVGVAVALAAWPVLRSILYDVQPFDPLAIGLAPAILLIVCATAAWLPSRRATRISAAAALRCE